jgi:hypothetical protein
MYTSPPSTHGKLFDFIANRLIDSFEIPNGVMMYSKLMLKLPGVDKMRRQVMLGNCQALVNSIDKDTLVPLVMTKIKVLNGQGR